jgi:hypothetical protein
MLPDYTSFAYAIDMAYSNVSGPMSWLVQIRMPPVEKLVRCLPIIAHEIKKMKLVSAFITVCHFDTVGIMCPLKADYFYVRQEVLISGRLTNLKFSRRDV